MSKVTKLALLALAFITMLGLSACGGNPQKAISQPVSQTTVSQEPKVNRIDEHLSVGEVKLPDGRKVVCVTYRTDSVTCDWATAQR